MNKELSGSANCLAPGVQVGEYRLQGVVGEGGFGIVYKARDLSLDRVVAVKEFMPATLAGRMSSNQIHVRSQHKGAFDAGLRSFINEARLLAKFSHPALVHVYRFFEENGTAYMVMRYYEGQTFRAYLSEQPGAMNERWLATVLSPVLDVLEMLHAADCFHRDIAPDNVFLQSSGMPVLLDFGAARRIIGDMTQALTMVLKPGYAPIEQYVDDGSMPQGAWTDIYQIGAMLYMVITGKTPATSVARMISDPVLQLTTDSFPGYSAEFLHGVHRALAVKPENRPQSIAELRDLLGIRTFTAPALSSWAASGAMPLVEMALPPVVDAPTVSGANLLHVDGMSVLATSGIAVPVAVDQTTGVITLPRDVAVLQASAEVEKAGKETVPPAPVKVIPTRPADLPSSPVTKPNLAEPKERRTSLPPPRAPHRASNRRLWTWLGVVSLLLGIGIVWSLVGERSDQVPASAVLASDETRLWLNAQKENSVSSLEEYLQKFPGGEHAAEAADRLVALSRPAAAALELQASTPTAAVRAVEVVSSEAVPPVSAASNSRNTKPPLVAASQPASTSEQLSASAGTRADAKASEPRVMGKVMLRVTPWGNVRVDRAPMGTTPPLTQLELPEGQHQIDISNPASPTLSKVIQVRKGEPVVINHKFE